MKAFSALSSLQHKPALKQRKHALMGMVDAVSRGYRDPSYMRRPLFNTDGLRPLSCSRHKLPGLVDVVSARCQDPPGTATRARPRCMRRRIAAYAAAVAVVMCVGSWCQPCLYQTVFFMQQLKPRLLWLVTVDYYFLVANGTTAVSYSRGLHANHKQHHSCSSPKKLIKAIWPGSRIETHTGRRGSWNRRIVNCLAAACLLFDFRVFR